MPENIFRQLQEQLDQYSLGYPATESGVEIEILKLLFNEEEAVMYLHMSMMLETPESVAGRLKKDPAQVALLLDGMAEKGLLFRTRKGDESKYGAAPFVVGIYEFQLKTMDVELARLFEDFFEEAFTEQGSRQVVPMRTIPVKKSIGVSWKVTPYEDARGIIKSMERLAVADCICRVQQGLLDQSCDKPLEVCFLGGSHGAYYVDRGMGRWVDQEEALEILDKCEEAGLVPQPFNAVNPGGMCNCCGDCCGMLRTLKRHPRPVEIVVTNHYAMVDQDLCVGCEVCLDRCQMDAVTMGDEGSAQVNLDRCIGCGLCVTTCDVEAMTLEPKSSEDRREPPAKAQLTLMELAQKRGKSLVPLAVMKG
ncbi:MAG: 4Fe-4S binding protein [Deltaproteobacteria bacterium]|jgi:Na+-translocating ferredoxin:NAD+ oxidoreductase subunit B|nr:4Fe-4S binding protein [Deltaproteobacteria bacterium]